MKKTFVVGLSGSEVLVRAERFEYNNEDPDDTFLAFFIGTEDDEDCVGLFPEFLYVYEKD